MNTLESRARRLAPSSPGALRRAGSRLAWVLILVTLSGCVDLQQILRVRPDGGGELLFEVRFDRKLLEEEIESGGAGSIEEALSQMLSQASSDAETQAGEMGEGVRFVAADELSGDKPGVRLRFEFEDVSRLRLTPFGPLGAQGGAPGADGADPLEFAFEQRGGRSVLTTALFSAEELAELERELGEVATQEPAAEGDELMDEMAKAMMEMMKELLQGLKVAFFIEPIGEIADTNATYRDGNRLTLFRFDFGALLADEEKLAAFAEQQEEPSMAALRRLVGQVEGMEMETAPELRIEFAGD